MYIDKLLFYQLDPFNLFLYRSKVKAVFTARLIQLLRPYPIGIPNKSCGFYTLVGWNANFSQPCMKFQNFSFFSSLVILCTVFWSYTFLTLFLVFNKNSRGVQFRFIQLFLLSSLLSEIQHLDFQPLQSPLTSVSVL